MTTRRNEIALRVSVISVISTVIAGGSLIFALYQGYLSRTTSKIDMRAWVDVLYAKPSMNGQILEGEEMHFNNSGKTPARNTRVISDTIGVPIQTLPITDLELANIQIMLDSYFNSPTAKDKKREHGIGSIAPSAQRSFSDRPDKVKEGTELGENPNAKTFRNYWVGTIIYEDLFDETHTTQFCVYNSTDDPENFHGCSSHNEMN